MGNGTSRDTRRPTCECGAPLQRGNRYRRRRMRKEEGSLRLVDGNAFAFMLRLAAGMQWPAAAATIWEEAGGKRNGEIGNGKSRQRHFQKPSLLNCCKWQQQYLTKHVCVCLSVCVRVCLVINEIATNLNFN